MMYIAIGIIGTTIWMAYEVYCAPMMDDDGNITKPGRKISDLWRKRK
jgi:hypothetical protein